jgi:hypothetical protein
MKAAQEIDADETAEAMEVTAEVVEKDDAPLDLDELAARFEQMFEKLGNEIRQSSPSVAQLILITVAAALITIAIQIFLGQLGVYWVPPQPPSP